MLNPYKFQVVPIVQRLDDSGKVLGELEGQPVSLFGVDALVQWALDFPDNLAKADTTQRTAAMTGEDA